MALFYENSFIDDYGSKYNIVIIYNNEDFLKKP